MRTIGAIFAALAALFQSCFGVRPYDVPAGTDIHTVVEGSWDWTGRDDICEGNPHRISFSPDRRRMVLTFAQPIDTTTGKLVATYDIRGTTSHSIRGFMLDEDRRTDDGELVVWDLVLTSPNSYRWHRTDWPQGSYTPEVIRCGVPPP